MTTTTEIGRTAWDDLFERMLMSLNDQDSERLEKCRAVARRKLARRGLAEPPVDKEAVKRYLLMYAKLDHQQGKCMRDSGVDKTMLLTAYDLWPESKFVRDYLAHMRHAAVAMEHEDMVSEAMAGLRRMNTDEECRLNPKSIMFTLENLDRENFGERRNGGSGAGRAGVTYNIPNLTINAIMSPDEIAERMAKRIEAASAVDVEAVERSEVKMVGVV